MDSRKKTRETVSLPESTYKMTLAPEKGNIIVNIVGLQSVLVNALKVEVGKENNDNGNSTNIKWTCHALSSNKLI